jgi:hypothetical protein
VYVLTVPAKLRTLPATVWFTVTPPVPEIPPERVFTVAPIGFVIAPPLFTIAFANTSPSAMFTPSVP